MRIAIAAIFKDECEYILEWIAYHRTILGIEDFIIADNASNDGTTQLLQALEVAGLIKRLFAPRVDPLIGPQAAAYNQILKLYGKHFDYILFIDADEFLVNNSGKDLKTVLKQHEKNKDFAGLALNWRIFGSSGNHFQQPGLVIERFKQASLNEAGTNRHVKCLVSPKHVSSMAIHHATLKKGYKLYNEHGNIATFRKVFDNGDDVSQEPSPYSDEINNSQIYVAHYVIKSKAEHFTKKAKRGSAAGSTSREKGEIYFKDHDLNNVECLDLAQFAFATQNESHRIKQCLNHLTPYYSYIRSYIDKKQDTFCGWACSDYSDPLVMCVCTDDNFETELKFNVKRKDLVNKGYSRFEASGFNYAWDKLPPFKESIRIWIKGSNHVLFEARKS